MPSCSSTACDAAGSAPSDQHLERLISSFESCIASHRALAAQPRACNQPHQEMISQRSQACGSAGCASASSSTAAGWQPCPATHSTRSHSGHREAIDSAQSPGPAPHAASPSELPMRCVLPVSKSHELTGLLASLLPGSPAQPPIAPAATVDTVRPSTQPSLLGLLHMLPHPVSLCN